MLRYCTQVSLQLSYRQRGWSGTWVTLKFMQTIKTLDLCLVIKMNSCRHLFIIYIKTGLLGVCVRALNDRMSLQTDTADTWTIQRESEWGQQRAGCPAPTENRLCTVSTWIKLFNLNSTCVCSSQIKITLSWVRWAVGAIECVNKKSRSLIHRQRWVFICRYSACYVSRHIAGKLWSMCRTNILFSSACRVHHVPRNTPTVWQQVCASAWNSI